MLTGVFSDVLPDVSYEDTSEVVTVPGRGGRPRKWSSDADRKRAFRARRRGAAEPSTFEVALDQGEASARAVARERELRQQLVDAERDARALRREAVAAKRELDRQRRRFGWIVEENAHLRGQVAERPPSPNRAERRRADRERTATDLTRVRARDNPRMAAVMVSFGADGLVRDDFKQFFVGWPDPPGLDERLAIVAAADEVVVARDHDARVVGFATALTDHRFAAYIPLVEVLPEFQRQGVGSLMLRALLDRLSACYMIDLACDDDVVPFYERLGGTKLNAMAWRNRNRPVTGYGRYQPPCRTSTPRRRLGTVRLERSRSCQGGSQPTGAAECVGGDVSLLSSATASCRASTDVPARCASQAPASACVIGRASKVSRSSAIWGAVRLA